MSLNADQLRRYSRHIILPQIGTEGQERLLSARVLIVGAGGLGCPVSLYLTAAGVGHIGLIDPDRVDTSNLQRQVLYTHDDVGQRKVEVAERRLRALNPDVDFRTIPDRFTAANAMPLLQDYDYVVDGTDNFPTRYLVNDACVLAGKINVYGSIFRFDGQASVFGHPEGPCYRCILPEPPPPGSVPNCAEGGVLGVLPGQIGLIQAMETVKLITGVGETLIGRLLCLDALSQHWSEVRIKRDPGCPVCGDAPSITELREEAVACDVEEAPEGVERLEPAAVRERLDRGDALLLDVREPYEYDIAHLPDARLIPLNSLLERLDELPADRDRPVVAYCHHGLRSMQALRLLSRRGFRRLVNLEGGIDRWSQEVDPDVPRY